MVVLEVRDKVVLMLYVTYCIILEEDICVVSNHLLNFQ